ncbi:MAG: TrkA C-terminal domain-containing protein [Candidatus Methanomethylophilaceae archaeon]|nr:TrkA C-terminal domain-containing protein [Candidatus Methanomethylophilaceae archaeon]
MAESDDYINLNKIDMSLKELLTEMKDISEVIVDLAYAALMFDSEDIAQEVEDLEEEMDDLKYAIRIKAMMAARTKDDAMQLSGLLQIANAAENIANAAADMVRLQEFPLEQRPFLSFILKESEEKIRMTQLSSDSDMVNHTIGELAIESNTGMRIIAIKGRQGWIYDPEPDIKLRAHDSIIVRGTEDGFRELVKYTSGKEAWEPEEVATDG